MVNGEVNRVFRVWYANQYLQRFKYIHEYRYIAKHIHSFTSATLRRGSGDKQGRMETRLTKAKL